MNTKLLFLSLLCFLFMGVCSSPGFAQCIIDHQVKVEAQNQANSLFKIELTIKNTTKSLRLQLYEIMDPKFPKVDEKVIQPAKETIVLFEGLKKGTYSIVGYSEGCTITVGGIHGIDVGKTTQK